MHINTCLIHIVIICCYFFTSNVHSQKITAIEGSFGIDKSKKIIVWHNKNMDSLLSKYKKVDSLNFEEDFAIIDSSATIKDSIKIKLSNRNEIYSLYVTKLPVIHITTKNTIVNDPKVPANITYFYQNKLINNLTGIELRGNISLNFPKKNYDLEIWTDSITKNSKDVKFHGLRNDDDWILDAIYTEPLRIRSHFAQNLWKKIHKPQYHLEAPNAKSGIESKFVEVFKNNTYIGLHTLLEPIDRKLLMLKKSDQQQVYGELFKASAYEGGPSFSKAPPFKNIFPHWAGFQMRYPVIDYNSHWDDLHTFVNLVVNGTDNDFISTIEKWVAIENIIDYYLFINLIRATDNLGKNYYLGKYDKGYPYFFIVWDLDGVMGINPEGKRAPRTKDILSNGLFDRLLKLNPNRYKEKLKSRWLNLRETDFNDTNLLNQVDKLYTKFKNEKIYEREAMLWQNESNQEQYIYLKEWIKDRTHFLDSYFNEL